MNDSILFYGHSVLDYYPWDSVGPWPIRNFGRAGWLAKQGYIYQIEKGLLSAPYSYIVIYYGINELLSGLGIQTVTYWLDRALQYFQRENPQVQIIVVEAMHNFGDQPFCTNKMIDNLNKELGALAKENETALLSWQGLYQENGCTDSSYSFDGIHLNESGYAYFEAELTDWINEKGNS